MRLPVFAHTRPWDWIRFLVAAAAVLALPLVFHDPFFILVLQSLAYLFIVALGLDILVGWTGQISLGHAGLYAIGAYTSALLATRAGWPFWITAPIGVVLAGVAGALLAIPSLRAKGPYLAMVTLAFGFMMEVTSNRWQGLTNGPMGISGIPAPTLPDGEEMTPSQPCFDVVLAFHEPVHRRVDVVGRRVLDAEIAGEGRGLPPPRRRQLRRRPTHPSDDQRHRQITLTTRRPQHVSETERPALRPHRRHMTMRQGTLDLETRTGFDVGLTGERLPDQPDRLRRQMRQIRQRLVLDLAVLTKRPAQQRGLIHPVLVVATSRGHMHGTKLASHTPILHHTTTPVNIFSDYTQ